MNIGFKPILDFIDFEMGVIILFPPFDSEGIYSEFGSFLKVLAGNSSKRSREFGNTKQI